MHFTPLEAGRTEVSSRRLVLMRATSTPTCSAQAMCRRIQGDCPSSRSWSIGFNPKSRPRPITCYECSVAFKLHTRERQSSKMYLFDGSVTHLVRLFVEFAECIKCKISPRTVDTKSRRNQTNSAHAGAFMQCAIQ